MKIFSLFLFVIVILTVPVTTKAIAAETKQKNHKFIVEELVPQDFPTNEMEKKVLKKGAVNVASLDSPQYIKEHEQAYKWLYGLYERKELMGMAHEYQTKTKVGKPIEYLHQKAEKKGHTFLAILVSHVVPPSLQWSIALANYKRAIDLCKNNPNRCAITKYKKWHIRGSLAKNMNCLIANMGASYVAIIEPFVQEKMKLLEEATPGKAS